MKVTNQQERNPHKKELQELGITIAYYRKLKKLTQNQLAEKVNTSRTHISNIEAREQHAVASLPLLFDIANALDVPVYKLFLAPDRME